MHNTGNNKPPGSRCDVTGGLDNKSPELFRLYEACRSPSLLLMGDTLATEGILIFQT